LIYFQSFLEILLLNLTKNEKKPTTTYKVWEIRTKFDYTFFSLLEPKHMFCRCILMTMMMMMMIAMMIAQVLFYTNTHCRSFVLRTLLKKKLISFFIAFGNFLFFLYSCFYFTKRKTRCVCLYVYFFCLVFCCIGLLIFFYSSVHSDLL
jgi:hypothetical protein